VSFPSILQAFATVFPAELPDKTMVASIVLVARYRRPLAVWLGATAAFTVHVVVAVSAGRALTLIPATVVKLVVTALFVVGAVVLFRSGRSMADEVEAPVAAAPASVRETVVASFALVVVAEWGDLTQLATASLAARSDAPVSIAIGALLALSAVAAIAATVGRQLVARVPLHLVNYVAAAVFAGLAVWTIVELVR
jgi:Ca2+/H+ antiporter, TMEM165/GDT1 family